MDSVPALEAFAYRWVAKLENIYPHIERCEVVIESLLQDQRHGKRSHARVTVVVRDPELDIVGSDHVPDGMHDDLCLCDDDRVPYVDHDDAYLALRDAFRAARRCLVLAARRESSRDHSSLR